MFKLYTKEDTNRYIVHLIIGLVFAMVETAILFRYLYVGFVLTFIISVIIGATAVHFLVKRVSNKMLNRIASKMTTALKTLNGDELRTELRKMDQFVIENPKKAHMYAISLFSFLRIVDGPEKSEMYLDIAKRSLKTRKVGRLQRANFTIELCYHYLLKNDIEMFQLAVKKLKTYHYTDFEKLNRKFGHLSSEHNPTEYKELAFISKLYVQGPDEEKIERLLNTSKNYYKMIYTYALMNYYTSRDDIENTEKYKKLLNEFDGNVFPLVRNDQYEL